MNQNFKYISTIVMILLFAILVGIFISYYTTPVELNHNVILNEHSGEAMTNHENNTILDGTSTIHSGEIETNIIASGEEDNEKSEEMPTFVPEDKGKNNNEKVNTATQPVIISSETSMTSKEKRQILTELDDALMELLEVVDKVQTIDESRLTTQESEGH